MELLVAPVEHITFDIEVGYHGEYLETVSYYIKLDVCLIVSPSVTLPL